MKQFLKQKKLVACFALFLGFLLFANSSLAKYEDSVLAIAVTKQAADTASPWQKKQISIINCLGTLVSDGLVLTTAFALSDSIYVEVRRFGSQDKHEAKIVFIDYEANLAVLRPVDKKVMTGMNPIEIGSDVAVDEKALVYIAQDAYQMARHPVRLNEVGVFQSLTGSYNLINYKFKVQQTELGWSEPILKAGKLIAVTTGQSKQYLFALPASIIKHFLNDALNSQYRGFPSAGISLKPLISPIIRKMLGVLNTKGGVRISRVYEGSAFEKKLFKNDVLVAVNGVRVSEHGYYRHKLWGKIHLMYLLNSMYGGDTVTFDVIREGEPKTVSAVVSRYSSNKTLIPYQHFDHPVDHLIFGGLVFQELRRSYLQLWGKDWENFAPFDLLYFWKYENEPYYGDNDGRRLVVLGRVLADEFNTGYEELKHQVLATVNGQKINSIADVARALQETPVIRSKKPYARFVFERDGGEIVLGYDGLDEVHKRISNTYEVSSIGSFFKEREL